MWLLGTPLLSLIRKLSSRWPANSEPTVTYRTAGASADARGAAGPAARPRPRTAWTGGRGLGRPGCAGTALRSTPMLPILNEFVTAASDIARWASCALAWGGTESSTGRRAGARATTAARLWAAILSGADLLSAARGAGWSD